MTKAECTRRAENARMHAQCASTKAQAEAALAVCREFAQRGTSRAWLEVAKAERAVEAIRW